MACKTHLCLILQHDSLCEAFPLQKVLHSPIRDPAADYFFNHKLLDNCGLLGLPLFGSLLLSHPAMEQKQEMDNNQSALAPRPFTCNTTTQHKVSLLFENSTLVSENNHFPQDYLAKQHGSGEYSAVCPSDNDP